MFISGVERLNGRCQWVASASETWAERLTGQNSSTQLINMKYHLKAWLSPDHHRIIGLAWTSFLLAPHFLPIWGNILPCSPLLSSSWVTHLYCHRWVAVTFWAPMLRQWGLGGNALPPRSQVGCYQQDLPLKSPPTLAWKLPQHLPCLLWWELASKIGTPDSTCQGWLSPTSWAIPISIVSPKDIFQHIWRQ